MAILKVPEPMSDGIILCAYSATRLLACVWLKACYLWSAHETHMGVFYLREIGEKRA